MKSIRVTYTNGNHTETDINGTDTEILAYYLGRNAWFNLGTGDGPEDVMVRATRVEFLNPDGTVRNLTPQGIIAEAMNVCGNWDGVIILDAMRYRLAGVNFGPSTVAQMPHLCEPLVIEFEGMTQGHTKVINGHAVTRWGRYRWEVGTHGRDTVDLFTALGMVKQ